MMKKKYHWRPDVPDMRDHLYADSMALTAAAPLPASVDLRQFCSPVEDQGQLGSCTGNAIAGALEYLENVKSKAAFVDLSRLFIYYNERVMEGTVNQDAGAFIRDGVKSVSTLGVCTEALWPYNSRKFKSRPPAKAYSDALNRKALAYQRITSLDQMKHALANQRPVVFGISVYASFESDAVAQTGTVPMPVKGEQLLGGHAILAVGYDDATQRILVRNSWGPNWGMKGYFTLPYAYITNSGLSSDFWCITN